VSQTPPLLDEFARDISSWGEMLKYLAILFTVATLGMMSPVFHLYDVEVPSPQSRCILAIDTPLFLQSASSFAKNAEIFAIFYLHIPYKNQ
jgi:hypothetical protein